MEVPEDAAELAGRIAVQSIREAGEFYDLFCPLDGEFKIGNNWAETH
jgi:DNA polymerase-1